MLSFNKTTIHNNNLKLFKILILCLHIAYFYSCGAGEDYYQAEPVYEGKFVDNAVEGLKYETNTLNGFTNNNGVFRYHNGEIITFYLANIKLGETLAKPIISPVDLVENASGIGNQAVTNICRLLQSLDLDEYLKNGITISQLMRESLNNITIDINFNQSVESFEEDENVNKLFNKLKYEEIIPENRNLISDLEAQHHIRKTLYGELNTISITTENTSVIEGSTIKFNTIKFNAIGAFDNKTIDITDQVEWFSRDNTIVIMGNSGKTKGIAETLLPGSTLIEASLEGISAFLELNVKDAELIKIKIAPDNPKTPANTNILFTAIGFYSDNTIFDITDQVNWSVSNNSIANINNNDNKGFLVSILPGKTDIIAELNLKSEQTALIVSDVKLKELQLEPQNLSLPNGLTQQYTATGIYFDNTSYNITKQALWSSYMPSIATISNNNESNGILKSISVGSTTIQAIINDITATSNIIVTDAVLKNININPLNPSISIGNKIILTVYGLYTDNTIHDITDKVIWLSDNTSIAIISNSSGLNVYVYGEGVGTTTITASSGDKIAKTDITVN